MRLGSRLVDSAKWPMAASGRDGAFGGGWPQATNLGVPPPNPAQGGFSLNIADSLLVTSVRRARALGTEALSTGS
jgi:hypothetical protein